MIEKFQPLKNVIMRSFSFGRDYSKEYTCSCGINFDKYQDFEKHKKDLFDHKLVKEVYNVSSTEYVWTFGASYGRDLGLTSAFLFTLLVWFLIVIILQNILPNEIIKYIDIDGESRSHSWVLTISILPSILIGLLTGRIINYHLIKRTNLNINTIETFEITKTELFFIIFPIVLAVGFFFTALNNLISLTSLSDQLTLTFPASILFIVIIGTTIAILLLYLYSIRSLTRPVRKRKNQKISTSSK